MILDERKSSNILYKIFWKNEILPRVKYKAEHYSDFSVINKSDITTCSRRCIGYMPHIAWNKMCKHDELKKMGVSAYSQDRRISQSDFPHLLCVTYLVNQTYKDNVFIIQYFRSPWNGYIVLVKVPNYKFTYDRRDLERVESYISNYTVFYNNIFDIIKNVLQIFPNKENKIFRTYMLGIDLDNYEVLINNTKILALFDTKNIQDYLEYYSVSNSSACKTVLLDYLFDKLGKEKVWDEIILDKLYKTATKKYLKDNKINSETRQDDIYEITLASINKLENKLIDNMFYDKQSKKLHIKKEK